MSKTDSYDWYKRYPEKFIRGVRGLGADVIGAYAVILDLIYEDEDSCPNDPHWLGGILGCSSRKARSLIGKLLAVGKLKLRGDGRLINERAREALEIRANESRNHREAGAKGGRTKHENRARTKKINDLALAEKNRIEKNRIEKKKPSLERESCSHDSVSPEPSATGQDASLFEQPIIEIPTNKTGETYPVFQSLIAEYRKDYPSVDIEKQIRAMRAWSVSNGEKRKTKRGMPRFINAWLARAQDRGGDGCVPPTVAVVDASKERLSWLKEYAFDGRWIRNSSGNGVWKDTQGVGPPPHDPRTQVTDDELAQFPKAKLMCERLKAASASPVPPML